MPKLHPTRNDIRPVARAAMADLLNKRLADLSDLASQVKHAHWNVKGAQFIALHELFDDLHEQLEGWIDDVAERCTALGGTALGTSRMTAKGSSLPEYPAGLTDWADHVEALADRYGQAGAAIRKAIDAAEKAGDKGTADLLTDVSRGVDKGLWFLESHLQG